MNLFRASSVSAQYGYATLSGILTVLSFPKTDLWPLAWVAMIPALVALHDAVTSGLRRIAAIGLVFGFVTGAGKVYWITETVASYGGLPWILGFVCTAIVALLLGSYICLFCIFVARADRRSALFPLTAAVLWTGLEYLQTYLFTGFPWELAGYSQYQVLSVIQIARITGVYGVSFIVVLVNATLATTLIAAREGWPWKPPIRALAVTCLLCIAVVGYGWSAIAHTQRLESQTPPVRVAVVQGNMEQGMKWSPSQLQSTLDKYVILTRSTLSARPQFVVFPETAMTFFMENPIYRVYATQVRAFVEEIGVPLLTGALGYDPQDKTRIYNSAYLLVPRQGITAQYSKIHLVPFGEYLPLSFLFFWLRGLTMDVGVLTPGETLTVMPVPGADIRVGSVICYESIFPDLVRRFVDGGANVLVVMTNDAWFGDSSAPMQHFSMAVFRAVENGVPVIRAANTGVSGYISATGRMSGLTPLMAATSTIGEVYPGRDVSTFYTRYGDVFPILCVIGGLIAVIGGQRRRGGA